MFDNIINLNNYFNIKEHFSLIGMGDTTNIGNSVSVKKSFENNQNINHSMLVESITKLVNNVSSDVVQKNSTSAASAVGSSNIISISNIQCNEIEVSDIRQDSQATNQTQVTSSHSNISKISNDISSTIDKTIEKIGGVDLATLQAENTKQLNDYMKATPGYDPDYALKLAADGCPSSSSLISAANTCNVNSLYDLDGTVKQALDLDDSFKINDPDDISNDIKAKLEQTNFASCNAAASASNIVDFRNIQCGVMAAITKANRASKLGDPDPDTLSETAKKRLLLTNVEQHAIAKLYMTCIFDQKNISDIANKIVIKIGKKYNQIYNAIEEKGANKGKAWMDDKMKLADLLAGAGAEKIIAAAGNLPTKNLPTIPVVPNKPPNTSENKTVIIETPPKPIDTPTKPIDTPPIVFKKPEPVKPEPVKPEPVKPEPVKPIVPNPEIIKAVAKPVTTEVIDNFNIVLILGIVFGGSIFIGIIYALFYIYRNNTQSRNTNF
jgi:hypothetical protein